MARPALEVADILRDHGPAWREANRSHVSLEQLKVMSAIERCRTAALDGHVSRCENPAMPLYAHHLACLHLRSPQPASVTSTIEVGAGVKSPYDSLPNRR